MKYFFLGRLIIFLLTYPTIFVASQQVPADKAQLNKWFSDNVRPLDDRISELEPAVVAAEKSAKVIKVRADGKGDFKTVKEAINSVPIGNNKRVVIWIGGGVYKEKLKIDRTKPFITLYGSPNDMPKLTYDDNASKMGGSTVLSASLIVESNHFVAANLIIENSSPRPDGKKLHGGQALAARFMGDKAAIYNCKFYGFQDTLGDDEGMHLYKDCFIQGTVDFIFGRGTTLYLNCVLNVVTGGSVITAHSKSDASERNVYSFVHCTITGKGDRRVYLGRAWRPRSTVIFSYTKMADIIHAEGWDDMDNPEYNSTVLFGEYKNFGPGSKTSGRVFYSKQLKNSEVKQYLNLNYIWSSKWLLPPPNLEA